MRSREYAPEILSDAETAIAAFEELIRNKGGDRSGLDAIISTWLPDARARLENVAKHSAYRGMRQIKGIAADASYCVPILFPGKEDMLDLIVVLGYTGLRCIRPGAILRLPIKTSTDGSGSAPLTLTGEPSNSGPLGLMLDRLCAGGLSDIQTHTIGHNIAYAVTWGNSAGMGSARNFVIAELRRECLPRYFGVAHNKPFLGLTQGVDTPSRAFLYDLYIHESLFPNQSPELRIIENGLEGVASPSDPVRDLDLIDVMESIEPLGTGFERSGTDLVDNYPELLEEVVGATGFADSSFRGYRAQIEYPIFGTQIQLKLRLPTRT